MRSSKDWLRWSAQRSTSPSNGDDGFPDTQPFDLDPEADAATLQALEWGAGAELQEEVAEVKLVTLRSVGLGDMRQVVSHQVNHVADATSHVVRFRNGGLVKFAHAPDGQLIELSGERITARVTPDGEVLISAMRKASRS